MLILAAASGYIEIVVILIDRGADVNAVDRHGYTPLILSTEAGCVEIVETLINKGASIDVVGKNRCVALYNAIKTSKADIGRCIVGHIAKLEVAGLHVSQETLRLRDLLVDSTQPSYNMDIADSYKRSFRKCCEEIRKVIKEDKSLYAFLTVSSVSELVNIWEVNRSIHDKFDKKEVTGIKEQYPEYANIFINKADKVKKEIFLHNHKPLVDVLSAHYQCDIAAMEFAAMERFFRKYAGDIVVDFVKVEKSLRDFVDFKDVKLRCVPKLELQSLSSILDNPSITQHLVGNRRVLV